MNGDWGRLEHAYGPASDAPEMFDALLSDSPDQALGYLHLALLHQGSFYSATAPAALRVASLLGETSARVRAEILEWLDDAARSAADRRPDCVDIEEVAAFRAVSGDLVAAITSFIEDGDENERALTRRTLTALGADIVERLNASAAGKAPHERADIAIAIGECCRVPWDLLADPHPGVRTCAALAPVLDPDPAALDVVKVALRSPETVDGWFDVDLPQLGRPVRYALVDALLRRTETFEEIAAEACAVIRTAAGRTVAHDWGPLLHRAFERRYRPGRTVLTRQQRDCLQALCDNDEIWTVSAMLWIERAGLPVSRSALRELTREAGRAT